MKTPLCVLVAVVLLLAALAAVGQQQPSPSKTIPDSINYMWKMVESDFTSLAEAMPEEKWNFKPAQGAFTSVRTFGEQVKHVACANATSSVPTGSPAALITRPSNYPRRSYHRRLWSR